MGIAAGRHSLPLALVVVVAAGLIEIGNSQNPTSASSLFLCQPSSDQSGRVYTPNIPDFYFNDANAADFRTRDGSNLTTRTEERGTTFIFSIPPRSPERNCSGTVTALQYCSQARESDINFSRTYFRFSTLTRDASQFTVNSRFDVATTPQENVCTDPPGNIERICCTTTTLTTDRQFRITSSVYSFGVILRNANRRPLAFANSNSVFGVEQFQVRPSGNSGAPIGNTITVGSPCSDCSLMLLRFLIDPDETPTTAPVTTEMETTEPATTEPLTAPPTTEITTEQITTPLITTVVSTATAKQTTPLITTVVSTELVETTAEQITAPLTMGISIGTTAGQITTPTTDSAITEPQATELSSRPDNGTTEQELRTGPCKCNYNIHPE